MLRCDPNSLKVKLVKLENRAYSEKKNLMDGVGKMKNHKINKYFKILLILFILVSILNGKAIPLDKGDVTSLISLLPKVENWKYSEEPQNFIPGNLYEYINGAAEIYLAYDFKELMVGQYEKDKEVEEASLSVEIYDMGNEKNSFGIYSAERFSESQFIPIGNQGYLEEGTLNFVVGRYYIKLLCFDCGEKSDEILKSFSSKIVNRVEDKGQFPPALSHFPREGLIQNTEKYILRNFMGYSFLHDGYVASYNVNDQEFDCFIIEGKDEEDAQKMLKQYLEKKSNAEIKETATGFLLKDRYYHNIFLARVKNHICGVMKIKDEFQGLGIKYLRMLLESLEK